MAKEKRDEIEDLLDELDGKKGNGKKKDTKKIAPAKADVTGVIPVSKLVFNEGNREADKDAVKELENSIKNFGLLVPVIIGDGGEVLDGERRARACISLGMKEIPFVRKSSEFDETTIVSNYIRRNLSESEAKEIFKRMHDRGMTQKDIAEKIGMTQARVSQILSDKKPADKKKKPEKKKEKKVERVNLPENVNMVVKKNTVEIMFTLDDEMIKNPEKAIINLFREIKAFKDIIKKERR